MEIFPSTSSLQIPLALEKEYKKARVQVDNSSRDFFKVSGLVKDCFIDGVSDIELSELGFGAGISIECEWGNLSYAVWGAEYIEDVVKDLMVTVYKDVLGVLKRNQYTLEKQATGSIDVFNKKGIKVAVLVKKIKKTSYSYSDGFLLTSVKQKSVDTTIADDKVIAQMWQLCKKAEKEIMQAADAVLELLEETGEDEFNCSESTADDIDTICAEANSYMKKLLSMCRKIKNDNVRKTVYYAIEDICEGPVRFTLQNWAGQTGWDAIGGLEDWAEVTFGDYLKNHDLSVFNR